jgi:hypothetical protein
MRIVHGDDGTVRFEITPTEWAKLGPDATMLLDRFGSVLNALVALRTGADLDAAAWHHIINDLHRLNEALEGVGDATLRAHHGAGGSLADLALAMDTERSTAQYRRDKVLKNPISHREAWAIAGGPAPLT